MLLLTPDAVLQLRLLLCSTCVTVISFVGRQHTHPRVVDP